MTKQVKVFFVFLAVSAVISVFSLFDAFTGVRSALDDSTKPLPLDVVQDEDRDGLSNTDESYWNTDFQNPDTDGDGFLDGEEVASGNDPREPAGDDNLNDTVFGSVKPVQAGDFEKVNFTDNMTSLLFGGLAAGDLKRDADPATKENGINALAVTTIDDFYRSFPVFSPELRIVPSTQENQLEYLKALGNIFKNDLFDFKGTLDTGQNPFMQTEYFVERANHFRKARDNASALSVPSNWVETHNKIIDTLNRFYLNHTAISNYGTDAVKAIIAFNDIENLNYTTRNLLKEVQGNIKANDLKPDDVVFQVMSTLLGTE